MEQYKSYRMYFCQEYTGQLNKFGGLPTHLPPVWPKDENGEDDLTFLCQLYCDGVKLSLENILCIQLYQWVEWDGQEGADVIVVPVPIGAKENLQGGWFHEEAVTPGREDVTPENFLGMIGDGDGPVPYNKYSPFNWGCGYQLVFYRNHSGELEWDFY